MLTSRPVPLAASRPLHTKTPSRALQTARGILQENALHGHRTAKAHRVKLQTPSRGGSPKSSRKLPKGAQPSKAAVNYVTRPLGDKTPFANRQRRIQDPTPGPAKENPPALDGRLELLTPGHALLPSSARKTVRGRYSSGPIFETPVSNGNHWDVLDDAIIAPVAQEVQGELVQSEDYDEIEYMPPTAIDPPYTPHFDVPDYKLMGIQLFEMMHSLPKDDALDRLYASEKECINDTGLLEASGFSASPSQWKFFELPDDDDPSPFAELRYSREASKVSAKVPPPARRTGHLTKGTSRATGLSRMPTTTTPAPNSSKQSVPHVFLKRGQAVPTRVARPTSIHPTRPVTATGRLPSTLRNVSASTPHIIARPATAASFRPIMATGTVKLPTKLRAGATPLIAKPEMVPEFEDAGVGNDNFMFDV
ncbi:hypothetical protein BC827DRAFT_1202994 [Russula dissimulans]|nr:hypothetical protein BC827DRAFT_1202994 [Russula dissimulans]